MAVVSWTCDGSKDAMSTVLTEEQQSFVDNYPRNHRYIPSTMIHDTVKLVSLFNLCIIYLIRVK